MKYKLRKAWRHFKYKLLELFFGKADLRRLIDIDRLDFEDAIKLSEIKVERWLNKQEYEFFNNKEHQKYNVKFGLQYAMARDMAEALAKHIEIMDIYDLDEEKYLSVGTIVIAERRD